MARAGGPSPPDALEVEAAKMVRRHPYCFSATRRMKASRPNSSRTDRIKREEKRCQTPKALRELMTVRRAACHPLDDEGLPHPRPGADRGLHVA